MANLNMIIYFCSCTNFCVAGVVVIEDGVALWGQAGVRSDVRIGKGAVLLAQAGLGEDIPAGKTYFGSPAGEARAKMKEAADQ